MSKIDTKHQKLMATSKKSKQNDDLIERNKSLSMIDCGIESFKDIPLHNYLKTINLHSNKLKKIESLNLLTNLVHLDISSNQIRVIDGLLSLHSLQSLNLSSNLIVSIENLSSLTQLKWLNISYNKITDLNGLSDLWGGEYLLETLYLNSNYLKELDQVVYYLSGLVNLRNITLKDNQFKNTSYAEFIFENVKTIETIDSNDRYGRHNVNSLIIKPIINEFIDLDIDVESIKPSIQPSKTKQEKEEPKLDSLENKIHMLLELRNKIKKTKCNKRLKSNRNDSDSSFDSSSNDESTSNDEMKRIINDFKNQNKKSPILIKNSRTVSTITDLTGDISSNNNKEEEKQFLKQIEDLKKSEDVNQNEIIELKKIINDKEAQILKLKNEQQQQQQQQQFNSSSNKENENSKITLIKQKYKHYYTTEIEKIEAKHEIVHQQLLSQIDTLKIDYKKLEDEFRSALIIESNRYNDTIEKCDNLHQECLQLRSNLSETKQADDRNKSLIIELNSLIKEQKDRLQLLNKSRKDNKDEINRITDQLNETIGDCLRAKSLIEQLKKDKKEIEQRLVKIAKEYKVTLKQFQISFKI
jgi:hypothetical protein